MKTLKSAVLLCIVVGALPACTQKQSGEAASITDSSSATLDQKAYERAQQPAPAVVHIRNAFLASALDAQGTPGQPVSVVAANTSSYVGAVLEGKASDVAVKVQGFDSTGKLVAEKTVTTNVHDAHVAVVELPPLAAGQYRVLVLVQEKPSWELTMQVQ